MNKDGEKVAYSIDAGFHVFLFMMKEHVEEINQKLKEIEGLERVIHTKIGKQGT